MNILKNIVIPINQFLMSTLQLFSVLLLAMALSGVAMASGYSHDDDDDGGHGRFYAPTELGPYKIGHVRTQMLDPTRNPDGLEGLEGRELTVDILYPSHKKKGDKWQATNADPTYDGNNPAYGLVDFQDTLPTVYGTRENVKIAKGKFPLLIYSHGSWGNSSRNSMIALNETLVSHGYIVASVTHSGNSTSDYAAFFLGIPTTFLGNDLLIRAQDVSFVITQLLDKSVSKKVKKIAKRINKNKIGLHGFSFGGGTTLITVAGSINDGLAPDKRIKAAAALDGAEYGQNVPEDYPNVTIPMLFVGDGNGSHANVFPQLVNSTPRYYADIAGALHVPLARLTYCSGARSYLEFIQNNPGDTPELIIYPAFYSLDDIAAQCEDSYFDGISDDTLMAVGYDLVQVDNLKPYMPLRKAVSVEEMHRMMKWYVVSFYNKELKHQKRYSKYLRDSNFHRAKNPLVDFAKNCLTTFTNAMDLSAGDKITMIPNNDSFDVTFSSGNSLHPKGSNNLNLGDDDSAAITLPFDFPIPGFGPTEIVSISSNGGITNLGGFGWTGAPWFMQGELLLTGQFTIAALITDLDPTAGGGVYAELEASRAIITWDNVPVYTDAGNGATNTVQIVLHQDGSIEMLFGDLAGIGPDYQPDWIGQVGIANGQTSADEFGNAEQVDFAGILAPVTLPATAIFEQYVGGIANICN